MLQRLPPPIHNELKPHTPGEPALSLEPQGPRHAILYTAKLSTLQTGGVLRKVQKCGRHYGVPRYRNGARYFEECCIASRSLVLWSRFE